jgi:hypothetical protein
VRDAAFFQRNGSIAIGCSAFGHYRVTMTLFRECGSYTSAKRDQDAGESARVSLAKHRCTGCVRASTCTASAIGTTATSESPRIIKTASRARHVRHLNSRSK